MDVFGELADNEPSSCSQVVSVNSQKGGHPFLTYVTMFWGHLCAAQCALAGGAGPRDSDGSGVFVIDRDRDKCDAGYVQYDSFLTTSV